MSMAVTHIWTFWPRSLNSRIRPSEISLIGNNYLLKVICDRINKSFGTTDFQIITGQISQVIKMK